MVKDCIIKVNIVTMVFFVVVVVVVVFVFMLKAVAANLIAIVNILKNL